MISPPALADGVEADRLVIVDPARAPNRVGRAALALVLASAAIVTTGWFDVDALRAAARAGPFGQHNTAAVESGILLGAR